MVKLISVLVLTLVMGHMGIVKAQSYRLDAEASVLNWTGYAAVGNYSPSGTLRCSAGNVTLKDGEITACSVIVDMKTLTHNNKQLERHLKQKDFFYVQKYPTAQLTFLKKQGDQFIFKLIIRGKSKPTEVPVYLEQTNRGLVSKGEIVLDRTQFDIKYNSSTYFQGLGNYAIKDNFKLAYDLVFKVIR